MTEDIKRAASPKGDFAAASEGEQGWTIRFGGEPIDRHLLGKNNAANDFIENKLGITAGPSTFFSHKYIEVLNPQGQVVKRIHGVGLEDGWKTSRTGRLVGMLVDGKYTKFSDDPVQVGDPNATRPNELQHADKKSLLTSSPYTKTVFTGSEREVFMLYGSLIANVVEINNKAPAYSLFGQLGPNSNSFDSEMRHKLQQVASSLNLRIDDFIPPGWNIGYDYRIDSGKASPLDPNMPLGELRHTVEQYEKVASNQIQALKSNGVRTDVTARLPVQPERNQVYASIPVPSPQ